MTVPGNFNNKNEENGFTSSMLRFNVKTESKHIRVKVLYETHRAN